MQCGKSANGAFETVQHYTSNPRASFLLTGRFTVSLLLPPVSAQRVLVRFIELMLETVVLWLASFVVCDLAYRAISVVSHICTHTSFCSSHVFKHHQCHHRQKPSCQYYRYCDRIPSGTFPLPDANIKHMHAPLHTFCSSCTRKRPNTCKIEAYLTTNHRRRPIVMQQRDNHHHRCCNNTFFKTFSWIYYHCISYCVLWIFIHLKVSRYCSVLAFRSACSTDAKQPSNW